jgi:hypothetical protein
MRGDGQSEQGHRLDIGLGVSTPVVSAQDYVGLVERSTGVSGNYHPAPVTTDGWLEQHVHGAEHIVEAGHNELGPMQGRAMPAAVAHSKNAGSFLGPEAVTLERV